MGSIEVVLAREALEALHHQITGVEREGPRPLRPVPNEAILHRCY
jgi:hypothetical protein